MPLFWLSLAFLMGIIVANKAALPGSTWLILASGAFGLAVLGWFIWRLRIRQGFARPQRSIYGSLALVLLVTFFLGGWRFQACLPDLADPNFVASHNDTAERLSITGVVMSFPDVRDSFTYVRLAAEDLRPYGTTTQHTKVEGLVLVRLEAGAIPRYGDRLLLHGFLETPRLGVGLAFSDVLRELDRRHQRSPKAETPPSRPLSGMPIEAAVAASRI